MTRQPHYRQRRAGFLGRFGQRPGKIVAIAIFLCILAAAFLFAIRPPGSPSVLAKNQTQDTYENLLFTYDINRYPANAEVSNASGENIPIGFSIDPWNLNFGIVPTGGSFGKRFITLKNSEDNDVVVRLVSAGDAAPYMEFSRNNFVLGKGESAPVEIIFRTKEGTPVGKYAGEVDVMIKKPKYELLRGIRWLG